MIENDFFSNEVRLLYGGKLDIKGMNALFPNKKLGCLNFGYWHEIPIYIDLKARLKSQIELYNKLFSYVDFHKDIIALEVGCGRGHGVSLLTKRGIEAWGIDIVKKQIDLCKKNYPGIAERFIVSAAEDMLFTSNYFDCLFSLEVAQHFPNFNKFAEQVHRVLKHNGVLVLSTFFYTDESSKNKILEIIPPNISGSHHMISIQKAENVFVLLGFKNIRIDRIGDKVFEGFSTWAKQQNLENSTPHSSKWNDAYKKQLIDYFVISCNK